VTDTVRAVARHLHHLPWVAAAVILAAGLTSWAMRPPEAAPVPEPQQPAVMIDEKAFRQALMPGDSQGDPFTIDFDGTSKPAPDEPKR
jgi:hypothetical protein